MEITLSKIIPTRPKEYLTNILGYKVKDVQTGRNEYGTLISWGKDEL